MSKAGFEKVIEDTSEVDLPDKTLRIQYRSLPRIGDGFPHHILAWETADTQTITSQPSIPNPHYLDEGDIPDYTIVDSVIAPRSLAGEHTDVKSHQGKKLLWLAYHILKQEGYDIDRSDLPSGEDELRDLIHRTICLGGMVETKES